MCFKILLYFLIRAVFRTVSVAFNSVLYMDIFSLFTQCLREISCNFSFPTSRKIFIIQNIYNTTIPSNEKLFFSSFEFAFKFLAENQKLFIRIARREY